MKSKFTKIMAALVLLSFLAIPMGMQGQSDYSTDYTGNITLSTTGGSNAYDCSIDISGTSYAGIKAGTSSKTGAVMITVPANTKYLHMHVAAWNNTTASLAVTPEGYSDDITLTANSGISGNSPFTFNGDPSTDDYYKVITFADALGEATELTFTAVGGKRFVIWGVTSEEDGAGISVATPTFNPANGTTFGNEGLSVTISCATQGVDLYYTLDGSIPDDESMPYSGAINLTTTTTIKAIAYDSDDNFSNVATATYTYIDPNAVDNIADIDGAGTYTVRGTIVAKSARGFIVGDGTGYVYYYNQNYTQSDYNIGDIVKLEGSVVVYGGVFEFNSSTTVTAAESSNYVAENPTVLSGADMDARVASTTPAQLSSYVQYEGTLTVSGSHYNITNIVGAETAIGSISYPIETEEITALDGKQVKVTGYYVGISTGTYYNTMLGSLEETVGNNPFITAENVSIDYNATSGAIAYTITNGVNGGVLTATTENEWLSLGTVGQTVPFTCSANTESAARTATVTLTYTYNRETVTKNVTVTQAGNPNTINNISDIDGAGTYSVRGTIVAKSARGFIVGDGTGYVYYYNQNYTQSDYNIGDIVKLEGSVVVYGGVFEFNSSTTVTAAESSNYVAENPTVLSGADMDTRVASTTPAQLSSYVQYEGTLTISSSHYNITNIVGAETAIGSISYPIETEEIMALDGKQVKVTGYYVGISSSTYYNTMLGSIEEIIGTDPIITITPARVDVPWTATEGTLNVTYQNIEAGQNVSIVWFEADGETPATCNWITTTINENTINYTISANTGEARLAYLRVKVGNVYSNLVTFSQGHYVVDYATLPFAFDGGRADIATTNGLTHEGLDSDYSSSPKLKFNTTGDWVILHFDGKPGMLTFDIKGNPSSGVWAGTFKVQTSEDGVTYTDLEAYTDLTSTVQSEEFNNLDEDVRYIKWIYTEKGSGNVALGNIVLYEFGGGPVIETYDLTIEPFENLEIFTFIGGDENNPFEGAGTIQVTEGDQVMLSVSAEEGYVMQSLIVDGVEHVNDIDDDLTYTFNMPSHNVTISATAIADIPFEPATYTLATTIESGKTYIIVGSKTIDEETSYFAMGEQKNNNRAGVAISVDGTTATVNSADVYEFVITALEEGGFYSIYDNRTPGYLYASGPNNNLKTEPELDTVGNGDWEISIDSVFHIVASHSSNRNVMQFNYNGGNTLFSCYSSANQSPVYLYVKEEATTEQTQTIALTAGFNWISSNVEITLDDLKAALVEALPGATSIKINSQSNGTTTYNGTRWRGQLNAMDLAQMYMVEVPTDCEMTLQGMPINVADHPVTIHSGNNWIAFPLSENMTLTNAFAGFVINGDKVTSQTNGTATYTGRWRGQLTTLEAGKGYMYESAATSDRTFTFPANAK